MIPGGDANGSMNLTIQSPGNLVLGEPEPRLLLARSRSASCGRTRTGLIEEGEPLSLEARSTGPILLVERRSPCRDHPPVADVAPCSFPRDLPRTLGVPHRSAPPAPSPGSVFASYSTLPGARPQSRSTVPPGRAGSNRAEALPATMAGHVRHDSAPERDGRSPWPSFRSAIARFRSRPPLRHGPIGRRGGDDFARWPIRSRRGVQRNCYDTVISDSERSDPRWAR